MQGPNPVKDSVWTSRPWLARGVQAVVVLVPVAVSIGVVTGVSRLLPRPPFSAQLILWWAVISLCGLTAALGTERLTRRLLPLAALLRVSLAFPDHTPTRFALARRAARPEKVVSQLRQLGATAKQGDLKAAQTVLELTAALSVHDRRTRGHSERVRVLTDMIADELRLPERDKARLRWAALLHDIGKLLVPASLLNKPGRPTDREWQTLRAHPAAGARLIAPLVPWLERWGPAVEQHHEWYDGHGYPKGLRGEEISLGARIVAVADIYDTITATRPYRRPVSVASARAELVRVAGSQLDPGIVRAFLNVSVGRLWRVVGLSALLDQIPVLGDLATVAARVAPGLGSTGVAAGAAGVIAIGGTGLLVHPHSTAAVPMSGQLISANSAGPAARPGSVTPSPASPAHHQASRAGGRPTTGAPTSHATGRPSPTAGPTTSGSHGRSSSHHR